MKIKLLIIPLLFIFSCNFNNSKLVYPNRIIADSYLIETEKNIFDENKLYDENNKTSYSTAFKNGGINSGIIYHFNDFIRVDKIKIINGFNERDDYFIKNNRVKIIEVIFLNNEIIDFKQVLKIQDNNTIQTLPIHYKKPVNQIQFIIKDIYKGKEYNDTCISEINVFGFSDNKKLYFRNNLVNNDYKKISDLFKKLNNKIFNQNLVSHGLSIEFRNNNFVLGQYEESPYIDEYSGKFSLYNNEIILYPYYFHSYSLENEPRKIIFDGSNEIDLNEVIKFKILKFNEHELNLKLENINCRFYKYYFDYFPFTKDHYDVNDIELKLKIRSN